MATDQIRSLADALLPVLTAFRQDLHQHPELSFQETRTAQRVHEKLKALNLTEVRTGVGQTGLVGLLTGSTDGPVVALRADMDALPIHEETGLPFASQNDGVMHACGHDAHTTMCLGAAMILSQLRDQLPGRVKFLFQPAEEILAGAKAMIADEALQNPAPDAIFGIHVGPEYDQGSIGISDGPVMAAADRFIIRIKGKGGHGAHPEGCVDPIMVAHEVYNGIRAVERQLHGLEKRIVSVCRFEGGTAFNIIPNTAELEGTVRTFDSATQDKLQDGITRVVKHVCAAHGAEGELDYQRGCPPVINDLAVTVIARQAAEAQGLKVVDFITSMGAEDYAFYLQQVPGGFYDLGTRTPDHTRSVHDSRFAFDNAILADGAAFLAQCAWTYLHTHTSGD